MFGEVTQVMMGLTRNMQNPDILNVIQMSRSKSGVLLQAGNTPLFNEVFHVLNIHHVTPCKPDSGVRPLQIS